MDHYALMVIADEPGTFHWVVLKVDGQKFENNKQSAPGFRTYLAALDAGAIALAEADAAANPGSPAPGVPDETSQRVTRQYAGR